MIGPQKRLSVYDIARPPTGFTINALVVCTYSASLDTVLSLPAAMLADLTGVEKRGAGLVSALELATLKRVCDHTLIFCQGGAILPAAHLAPTIIEAEQMVHEVKAPMGGAFHPKVWVIRFTDPETGRFMLRVAILSRNLTADRSWDLGVVIDSRDVAGPRQANDLGDLLRLLPSWCARTMAPKQLRLLDDLINDVERVHWRLPDGIGRLSFHGLGFGQHGGWNQPNNDRLVVISPFLTARALQQLSQSSHAGLIVISRCDALDRCWDTARDGFARQAVLAAPDDPGLPGRASELHGKALVWQIGARIRMAIGSMNATSAAIEGRNVEFMASFDCTKALGENGIHGLLDSNSLGAVIEDYEPSDASIDQRPPFDDRPARTALWNARLHILCTAVDAVWKIALVAEGTVSAELATLLPGLRFRPATLGGDQATRCGAALAAGEPAACAYALEPFEITGFTVFDADGPDGVISFTLNLEVRGIDEEARRHAVLKAVLPDGRHYAEFLRILLGDFAGLEGGVTANGADGNPPTWRAAGQAGLLELLIRCAADDPDRLESIRQTLNSLGSGDVGSEDSNQLKGLLSSVMAAGGLAA